MVDKLAISTVFSQISEASTLSHLFDLLHLSSSKKKGSSKMIHNDNNNNDNTNISIKHIKSHLFFKSPRCFFVDSKKTVCLRFFSGRFLGKTSLSDSSKEVAAHLSSNLWPWGHGLGQGAFCAARLWCWLVNPNTAAKPPVELPNKVKVVL